MKKCFRVLGVVFCFIFLFGCGSGDNEKRVENNTDSSETEKSGEVSTNTSQEEKLDVRDFFPIKENIRYIYEGKGNEYASYQVYNDYTSDSKVQQRIENGGTVVAKVIEVNDQSVTVKLSRGEAYYRENLLEIPSEEGEVLLKAPIKKGTAWTLKDSSVRTITNISTNVTTSLGSFEAIEVTTKGTSGKTVSYFVKDIGLIKSVFNPGENEVSSSLSKIEEDTTLIQNISFFYPNFQEKKVYYKNKDLVFRTNDITRKSIEDAYKEVISGIYKDPFSNTKINSVYLNNDGMVYVDLSSDFLSEIKANPNYEKMIIQCAINTFGKYYNVQKVVLTIENQPYESSHKALNNYIEVNLEGTIEAK